MAGRTVGVDVEVVVEEGQEVGITTAAVGNPTGALAPGTTELLRIRPEVLMVVETLTGAADIPPTPTTEMATIVGVFLVRKRQKELMMNDDPGTTNLK